jgi:uncharacterized protein YhaN
VSKIVRRLNSIKAPTKTGGEWSPASVRDILINPVYVGKIRWNWRHVVKKMVDGKIVVERPRASVEECIVVPGLHPPIVSDEVFVAAAEIMSRNPPRPVNERHTVTNPLAGLVVCGLCGRRMQRRPYGGKQATGPSLICPYTSCSNVSSYLSFVERRILDGLSEWLADYRLEWEDAEPRGISVVEQKRKELKKLRGELSKLNTQLDNLHDLLEQGVYSVDDFLSRSRILADRIRVAQELVEAAESEIELDAAREDSRKNIIPKVERLLAVYDELPDARSKNELLKSVLEKAVYTKRRGAALDEFELVLYPKLPPSG